MSPLHTALLLQGLCTFERLPLTQALGAAHWAKAAGPAEAEAVEGAVRQLRIKVGGLGGSGLSGREEV